MNINERLINLASQYENNVLHVTYEVEDDNEYVFDEIEIPENIEIYISDLNTKKLICHPNVKVIDLHANIMTDLDFNIVSSLKDIIIRHSNIVNKELMELFPKSSRYRYSNCSLNGVQLCKVFNEYYKKYFNKYPSYETVYGRFPHIQNNVINYRIHSNIIEEIRQYEANIKRAKEFSSIIKDELIEISMNPDRIENLLNKGYTFKEIIDSF